MGAVLVLCVLYGDVEVVRFVYLFVVGVVLVVGVGGDLQ